MKSTEETLYAKVYLDASKTHHLLQPERSPSTGGAALCGRSPDPFGGAWLGTGNQSEHDRASALPLCRQCGAVWDR